MILRRNFLTAFGAMSITLPSCKSQTAVTLPPEWGGTPTSSLKTSFENIYGAVDDGGYRIPAFPYHEVPSKYYRQEIVDPTGEHPGTIVVQTSERLLYLVKANGRSVRYGVSIGAEGFAWQGKGTIERLQKWPRWTPPSEMLARKPGLTRYASERGSMAPGLSNPLGARGLYIFQNGRDTLYRIHGTPEWQSIGSASSSGCVRMFNQDVIDLYRQVAIGTKVIVI